MAAPIVPLVSPIISAAATQAQKRLDEAKDAKDRQVDRLVAYLRAVVEAVKGLETEADELFSQCRWMDWADDEQRQAFLIRCGRYLDVDNLRLQLSPALDGLDESRHKVRERTKTRLQRSGTKLRREAVLSEVDAALGRYQEYLDALRLRPRISGVGAAELDGVRQLVAGVKTPEQAERAKEDALRTIKTSHANRIGYEVLGAIEALVVRVQDAFA